MTKPEMNDDKISEIINNKVAADNIDSGWMLALILMRAMAILREIPVSIRELDKAIEHNNNPNVSVTGELTKIAYDIDIIRICIDKITKRACGSPWDAQ